MQETYVTRARNSATVTRWTRMELKMGQFEQVVETRLLIQSYPADRLGQEIK